VRTASPALGRVFMDLRTLLKSIRCPLWLRRRRECRRRRKSGSYHKRLSAIAASRWACFLTMVLGAKSPSAFLRVLILHVVNAGLVDAIIDAPKRPRRVNAGLLTESPTDVWTVRPEQRACFFSLSKTKKAAPGGCRLSAHAHL